MKLGERQIMLEEAEKALRACLTKASFMKLAGIERDKDINGLRPDLLVELELPKGRQTLIAELKTNGQPRFAREAANQLARYLDVLPGAYGIFIAPFVSSESAAICKGEGIGYIDFAGNCKLSFGTVYIEQKGNPNVFAEKRDLRSLYSPKAERVLRVLLSRPRETWKVKDLANEADVSLGLVSNVKKLLDAREWLNYTPDGLSLGEPMKLLGEWSENYDFRKNEVRDFYSMKSASEIEADIADTCERNDLRYALTAFSGAARLAPSVRYQRAMVYVEESLEDKIADLGLKPVSSGANISLLYPYDEGVFYGLKTADSLLIASPVQIYLDLIGFRGRGEEAAEALLREVIEPQW